MGGWTGRLGEAERSWRGLVSWRGGGEGQGGRGAEDGEWKSLGKLEVGGMVVGIGDE